MHLKSLISDILYHHSSEATALSLYDLIYSREKLFAPFALSKEEDNTHIFWNFIEQTILSITHLRAKNKLIRFLSSIRLSQALPLSLEEIEEFCSELFYQIFSKAPLGKSPRKITERVIKEYGNIFESWQNKFTEEPELKLGNIKYVRSELEFGKFCIGILLNEDDGLASFSSFIEANSNCPIFQEMLQETTLSQLTLADLLNQKGLFGSLAAYSPQNQVACLDYLVNLLAYSMAQRFPSLEDHIADF